MDFLRLCLLRSFPPQVVSDAVLGLRPSTSRQYQSSWVAFQDFVRRQALTWVSEAVVYDFLSGLFHARGRAASTITTYLAGLADPLLFGFGLSVRGRVLDLMRRSFHLRRPPPRPRLVRWSLRRVLDHLRGPGFGVDASPRRLLQKTLFLVAMASGLRVSQLHALVRDPAWLVFAVDGSQVSLAPSPRFLAKNEREGRSLPPLVVRAWLVDGRPHDLCPVLALRRYLGALPEPQGRLFLWPDTRQPLTRVRISRMLCEVIEEADPGCAPRGHDVRSLSATLSFLRHCSLERLRVDGQWGSDYSFVHHYLDHSLRDVPCVTMSGPPSPGPGPARPSPLVPGRPSSVGCSPAGRRPSGGSSSGSSSSSE